MELVVADLVLYPQKNKHRGSHANSQSRNIDRGKAFIPKKIPVSDFEKISDHSISIIR
jgi:hypothetical protein